MAPLWWPPAIETSPKQRGDPRQPEHGSNRRHPSDVSNHRPPDPVRPTPSAEAAGRIVFPAVADDYETTLIQLAGSLEASHVAHRPLTTISATDRVEQARAIAEAQTLNNLPVVDAEQGVIGVLENLNGEIPGYARPREDVRSVRYAMRPLSDRILIESHSSLESLLHDLLRPPFYQLVVTAGEIDGIVTVSNLNKAPIRVLCYATVAHLETAMAQAIRRLTNNDDEAAVALLGTDGAAQVAGTYRRLRHGNLNADLLDATTLKQKGLILHELGVFEEIGTASVNAEFQHLYEQLRNPLMHMSPFVAETIEGLQAFAADLDRARQRTREAIAASR